MRASIACAFSCVGAFAAASSAGVILSYGYTDLMGSFDGSMFSASAADVGTLQTAGDVTRLDGAGGTAQFEPGFVGLGDMSDFIVNISVTNLTPNSARGSGSFLATDRNGDTISGDIEGDWRTPGRGIAFFNGLLSNVVLTNNSGDGIFDSPDGGFVMSDMRGSYSGAVVQLFTNVSAGFFNTNFQQVSTQISGEIIPSPGSAALLAMATVGLLVPRRTRR